MRLVDYERDIDDGEMGRVEHIEMVVAVKRRSLSRDAARKMLNNEKIRFARRDWRVVVGLTGFVRFTTTNYLGDRPVDKPPPLDS